MCSVVIVKKERLHTIDEFEQEPEEGRVTCGRKGVTEACTNVGRNKPPKSERQVARKSQPGLVIAHFLHPMQRGKQVSESVVRCAE